jgi:hypothetical protein
MLADVVVIYKPREWELRGGVFTINNRKLLQSNDDVIDWSIAPGILGNQGSPNLFELFIIEYPLRGTLDIYGVASVYEGLGGGWGECGAVLQGFSH